MVREGGPRAFDAVLQLGVSWFVERDDSIAVRVLSWRCPV